MPYLYSHSDLEDAMCEGETFEVTDCRSVLQIGIDDDVSHTHGHTPSEDQKIGGALGNWVPSNLQESAYSTMKMFPDDTEFFIFILFFMGNLRLFFSSDGVTRPAGVRGLL